MNGSWIKETKKNRALTKTNKGEWWWQSFHILRFKIKFYYSNELNMKLGLINNNDNDCEIRLLLLLLVFIEKKVQNSKSNPSIHLSIRPY